MSLVSKVSGALSSYARSWGVDPLGVRLPSRRELGFVAALSAASIAACTSPNGGGVNGPVDPPVDPPPPVEGSVVVGLPSSFSLDSGVLEVPYTVDRDFERCRLRLHGVTVAVDENVSAGDHVISFPRLRPNESYPVDILCSDEDGLTHDRGQIVGSPFFLSMSDFRSDTVTVSVGGLESCSFDPVQEYVASKGNLPVSVFAPLDSGCYWNPDVDSDRGSLEFVTPEEVVLIDWLSSEAKPEGMSDHTIGTLLSRTAGLETLLSRELVWWELDPRVWEDEVAFAQRGWRLYRENVSRGWQDGSFDLDYRLLGLMSDHWPSDYMLPNGLSDPSQTGIPINPGSERWAYLNLSDDYLNEGVTWLSLLGFEGCEDAAERKPIFGHDYFIDPDFARSDARFPDGVPYSYMLPSEGLITVVEKEYLDFLDSNDFYVAVLVDSHSRDLYKGAPAGFRFINTHVVPADRDGDGVFSYDDTDLSAGMIVSGYTGTRDGTQLMYTNPDHIFQIDFNVVGPYLGRLEARDFAWGGSTNTTDRDSPFFTYGMPRNEFGMVDVEMIERGSGHVGFGRVDPKYARIAGTSGSGLLVDLSVYGVRVSSTLFCEPYDLVFVDPE